MFALRPMTCPLPVSGVSQPPALLPGSSPLRYNETSTLFRNEASGRDARLDPGAAVYYFRRAPDVHARPVGGRIPRLSGAGDIYAEDPGAVRTCPTGSPCGIPMTVRNIRHPGTVGRGSGAMRRILDHLQAPLQGGRGARRPSTGRSWTFRSKTCSERRTLITTTDHPECWPKFRMGLTWTPTEEIPISFPRPPSAATSALWRC